MSNTYKVKFSYKQDSPVGGNTRYSGWKEEIKVYDANSAEELQLMIDRFLSDDKCGYRKYIKVEDISVL